ncbi:protein bfr2 [Drosophila guanche]|uniref:Blast:Coiled-coil domain-containing protein 43 n=1 Tax=Drosophila guanche TaxID=7266 RepID=A0A3B0JUR9_DROGU|nr:protein bfr2 [Drosophila guanche]SPP85857.1 blast:Coiled-coil domain-containing protein 43 [Drosophila guanche]
MRSRTELVTTTFVESDEEDYSPDDDSDSEEDWRPTKKRPPKQSRVGLAVAGGSGAGAGAGAGEGSRKRKAAGTAAKATKRRHSKLDSDDDSENDDDDDDLETDPSDEDFEYPLASTSKRPQSLPPKKQFVKLHQVDLLMKKADLLDKDWMKNTRLCLWRKDVQASLLQKFLRVKSEPGEEQLLFTSSSVYSSWDEQQIGDYLEVKANCLDPNNRRFKLHDLEGIMKVSQALMAEQQDTDDPEDDEGNPEDTELEAELESEPVPDLDEEDEEDEALDDEEEEAEDEGQEHTDETDP